MFDRTIVNSVKQYIGLIPPDLGLRKAYIFGSHAKGEAHEDSDIDVAVVLGHITDFFDVQMELMRLRRSVDLRIEPHPISSEDFISKNPLAMEIQKTGIEITT